MVVVEFIDMTIMRGNNDENVSHTRRNGSTFDRRTVPTFTKCICLVRTWLAYIGYILLDRQTEPDF